MPDILPDHAELVLIRHVIDNGTNVTVGHTWLADLDGLIQSQLGDFTQLPRLIGDGTYTQNNTAVKFLAMDSLFSEVQAG